LFLGMDGQAGVGDIIPITFNFNIKKNIVDEVSSQFTDLTMGGHDLKDYRYIKDHDINAGTDVQVPAFRFIHKVHKAKDFSIMKFPGA
ncbi:hypothetical protein Q2381_25720, partial [Escherichia coli]|nr:hypothetical protein [Escherichia coli]